MSIKRIQKAKERVSLAKKRQNSERVYEHFTLDLANVPPIRSDEPLFYSSDAASLKDLKRVQKVATTVDGTIDLHGLREDQALSALKSFFVKGWQSDMRSALIIHGQGSGSTYPALKNMVYQWLMAQKSVSAFATMPKNAGGLGATCVILNGGNNQ